MSCSASHPGDPTPRSPLDVMNDQLYRVIWNETTSSLSGVHSTFIVVFHCGTETYWATHYAPTQIAQPAQWHQVEPGVETTPVWRKVGATP